MPGLGNVPRGEDARDRRAAAGVGRDPVGSGGRDRLGCDSDRDDDGVGVQFAAFDGSAQPQLDAGLGVALRQQRADLGAEHALERGLCQIDERHRRA